MAISGHQSLPSCDRGHARMDPLLFTRKTLGNQNVHLISSKEDSELSPSDGEQSLEVFYLCLARGVWGHNTRPICDPRLVD